QGCHVLLERAGDPEDGVLTPVDLANASVNEGGCALARSQDQKEARHVLALWTLRAEDLAQIVRVRLVQVFRNPVGGLSEHPLAHERCVIVRIAQALEGFDPGVLNIVERKIADMASNTKLGQG